MSSSSSSKNSPRSTESSTQPNSEGVEIASNGWIPGVDKSLPPVEKLDNNNRVSSSTKCSWDVTPGMTWLQSPTAGDCILSPSGKASTPSVGPPSVMSSFGGAQLPQSSFGSQMNGMAPPFVQTPKMDLQFLDALRYPSIQSSVPQNHRPILGVGYGSNQTSRFHSHVQKPGHYGRYNAPMVSSFGGKIRASGSPFGNNLVIGGKQMYGTPTATSPDIYWHYNPGPDIYSRKVFVGGLPIDIDEDEINATFSRFGPVVVDWPHKSQNKAYFPPKGYVFLIFEYEPSVQSVVQNCHEENDKYYICVSSPTMRDKPVQVRPWRLADADFVVDANMPLDPRRTIFIGGVPRPLKAVELATIMDKLFGGVCYAGIDTDPELKYPKGAGRVAFSNQQSYTAAIAARFVQLQHGDVDKRVEVKPYVLDDQMCDECHGVNCNGKYAPFFCANVSCLQYFCESCWVLIHSRQGREYHKPMIKESTDRSPRGMGSRASTEGWQGSVYAGPKAYYQ